MESCCNSSVNEFKERIKPKEKNFSYFGFACGYFEDDKQKFHYFGNLFTQSKVKS